MAEDKPAITFEEVKKAIDHVYSIPIYQNPYIKVKISPCEYVMCHKCRHIFSYVKKYGVCDVCGKRWGSDDENTPFYFVNETGGTP